MVEWHKYIKVNLNRSIPQDLKPYIRKYFSTPVVIFRVFSFFMKCFHAMNTTSISENKVNKSFYVFLRASNTHFRRAITCSAKFFRMPVFSKTSITCLPEDQIEEYFQRVISVLRSFEKFSASY